MSPTQSETHGEPRRDNFTMHEEGTWENSERTHPQKPIAQSMLDQSKMRQQRNQAHKTHNMEKCASQKDQKRFIKEKLPENVHVSGFPKPLRKWAPQVRTKAVHLGLGEIVSTSIQRFDVYGVLPYLPYHT
ncbi:hypothetical protein O181_114680, partial [Austropuccinia psidii MF-1]|nr:hypothetical protein [Austropuccinia psidii MF-1]